MKRIITALKAGWELLPFLFDHHRPSAQFLQNYEPQKILVFGYMGLGDFLMLQPTLKAIHEIYPHSKITLLMGRASAAHNLCELLKIPAEIKIIDHLNAELQSDANRAIQREGYDLCLATYTAPIRYFLPSLKSIPLRLIHRRNIKFNSPLSHPLSFVRWIFRFFLLEEELFKRSAANVPVPIDQSSKHEMDKGFSLVQRLKPDAQINRSVNFDISQSDENFAQKMFSDLHISSLKKIVAMHPSASVGQSWKKWPEEKYADLIKYFDANNIQFLLFGTESEKSQVQKLSGLPNVKSLLGMTTPAQAAALFKKCDLFIGTDSGLGHLALLVGCPSLRLFGPSDQPGYAAWGKGLQKDIFIELPCRPCLVSGLPKPGQLNYENCPHMNCLNTLSLEVIVREAEKILGQSR